MTADPKRNSREAVAELRERIRTEGAEAAFNALLRVCNDPKASAQALATAGSTLFRATGLLEKSEDGDGKQLSEMSPEELNAALAKAKARLASCTTSDEDNRGVFD
jgi:hypothetical protein